MALESLAKTIYGQQILFYLKQVPINIVSVSLRIAWNFISSLLYFCILACINWFFYQDNKVNVPVFVIYYNLRVLSLYPGQRQYTTNHDRAMWSELRKWKATIKFIMHSSRRWRHSRRLLERRGGASSFTI